MPYEIMQIIWLPSGNMSKITQIIQRVSNLSALQELDNLVGIDTPSYYGNPPTHTRAGLLHSLNTTQHPIISRGNPPLTDARPGGAEDHRAVADWCCRCRDLCVPLGDCDPALLRPLDPWVRLLPRPLLDRPLINPAKMNVLGVTFK